MGIAQVAAGLCFSIIQSEKVCSSMFIYAFDLIKCTVIANWTYILVHITITSKFLNRTSHFGPWATTYFSSSFVERKETFKDWIFRQIKLQTWKASNHRPQTACNTWSNNNNFFVATPLPFYSSHYLWEFLLIYTSLYKFKRVLLCFTNYVTNLINTVILYGNRKFFESKLIKQVKGMLGK